MITGFNTEFRYGDRVFHVQTEDKGLANPKIQTLIYVKGQVLDSFQGDYSDLLEKPPVSESEISRRMEEQHKKVVSEIKSGKYGFAPDEQALADDHIFNDRPLEEALLEYLQKEGDIETLELLSMSPLTPKFGALFHFAIIARLCNSKFPIPNAKVSVKLISNFQKAIELMVGKTNDSGIFSGTINLPSAQPGNCAILLSCSSEHGQDEIKSIIST